MSIAVRDAKCRIRLPHLGGASDVGASRHGLSGLAHDVRPADRALVGHNELDLAAGALLLDDLDDLGNHLARALHDHRIADANVLAADLVLVMKRRVGDGDPADLHRFEIGHGRERAGAADLYANVVDARRDLLRGVLIRNCPTRASRDVAEPGLQIEGVDLDDHPVHVVVRGSPLLAPLADVRRDLIDCR